MPHNYGFGGKEEQGELGLKWLDFHARNYDPTIGRWMNIDALADRPEQIFMSPYQYGWNNPIYYTDPDGNCPKCWDFISDYASGAWSTGGSIALGAVTSQYHNAVNAVNSTKAVAGPLLEGNVSSAAGAYVNAVYETSGAKGAVETVTAAANGDAEAIGSVVTSAVAAYVGAKAGGSKSSSKSNTTGTAKVYQTNVTADNPYGHYTIETNVNNASLTTEQVVFKGFDKTSVGKAAIPGSPTNVATVKLPNAAKAQKYQKGQIGSDLGPYNVRCNSCQTHVGDVLRHGGVDVPKNSLQQNFFIKTLFDNQ